MLRSRIAASRLPRRLVHTTPRLLDRPPTFTVPEPAPPPASPPPPPPSASPSTASPRDAPRTAEAALPPLPPTNLPVEDYASPLLHTASFFSTLFRYAVYGSVGIVSLAVAGLVGVHLYVEHVELKLPPSLSAHDDPDEWLADVEGWSGAHTGQGGTDPRLGILARAAVRGAWISQHWGAGSALSPVSNHQATFGVSKAGGTMIGAQQAQASRGTPVNDAGWAMAEQYLAYAMRRAEDKGISLVEPADWEARIERGGVDRAAVELEERLAGLRERIGGRIKLEQARDGWERIYFALSASPTTDVSTEQGRKLVEWEQREKVTASRKLGELGGRIAEMWGKDTEEGRQEATRAQGWFVGGLVPVLARAGGVALDGQGLRVLEEKAESTKHVTPKTSFFSFWSRSHPTPVTTASSTAQDTPVSKLISLLDSAPSTLPPSTSRAVLSSLVSLETFLARTASDLASAQSVQSAALTYVDTLTSMASATAPQSGVAHSPLPPSTVPQASKLLTSLFLTTRGSVLKTHLSECALAATQQARPSSRTLASARESALGRLHQAREAAQSVLLTLPPPSANGDSRKADKLLVFAKSLSGDAKVKEVFEAQSKRIRRDAEKVDKIAGQLIDFLEQQQKRK
ncbi:hypothetical protein JCM10212_000752 [Sporobolomyces blumeae]